MRVFVAGATGAIGRRLVPSLVEAGHEATGMTRSPGKADALRGAGADPAVVDDDPAPVSAWLPAYAAALGAPAPRRLPGWVVRLAGGHYALYTMSQLRGACNARARERLGWTPQLSSWRQGFVQALG